MYDQFRRGPRIREENGIVLDFLQHGHINDSSHRPVAQVVGVNHLSLLEVAPKKGVFLQPLEIVYIGVEKRDKVHHIIRKINFNDLTETAKLNLEDIIEQVVNNNPQVIVDLFNKAGPISTRQHQLELIPGIGKKHMWAIIEEREKKPFSSIEDIKLRVPLMPDPIKSFIRRVIEELEGVDKHRIVLPLINLSSYKKV